jgi:uncharacterized membrane protein
LTDGTLYGAIYAAEYIMRMSSAPAMLYVGMHALIGTTGVYAVLNSVMQNTTQVDATTVTGGTTVPATGLGTIPAL